MGVLAMDNMQIGLVAIGFIWNFLVGLAMFALVNRQRKLETVEARVTGMEERLAKKIAEAADERHVLTTKLVDERFRAMTHELGNSGQQLVVAIAELRQRVKEAEEGIDGAGERDHKIELIIGSKLDAIKDLIRDRTASKEDLAKHESAMVVRVDRIENRIGGLEKQVAVFSDRMESSR